jgi:hypothetical protein
MGQGSIYLLAIAAHGELEGELTQAALPAFIAPLNQSGGHLLTVKPAVSLVSVFFKILDAAARKVQPEPTPRTIAAQQNPGLTLRSPGVIGCGGRRSLL